MCKGSPDTPVKHLMIPYTQDLPLP